MSTRAVIIVAGGRGSRLNSDLPKQFHVLSGLPVLMRSIRAFYLFDPSTRVILGVCESYQAYWTGLCEKYNFSISHTVVKGGESRFHTVRNCLELVPDDSLVAIHDGVRPLVSQQTISRTFREAELKGNAIPVIPVTESVRKVAQGSNKPVARELLRIIQTPQVFKAALIKAAYAKAENSDFSDDATVLETTGAKLHLVDGNPENIKITLPIDLLYAEAVLLNASSRD